MQELWKDIPGFENDYQVSNLGRVKSKDRIILVCDTTLYNRHLKSKILKQGLTKGYPSVSLHIEKKIKIVYVHRLVALAFIPNPYNLPQINHKDENPKNNCVDNLEWCDSKYNNNYGTKNARGSANMKGIKNHNYGKHLTEEHRNKISEALMGNKNRSK